MIKKLPDSLVERKNILNNPFAIEHIQKEIGIRGIKFEDKYIITSKQVALFFEIDEKTIDRYLSGKFRSELKQNGYEVLHGKRLQDFKQQFGKDIDVPTKTTRLGIFTFKSVINLAMLLVESEKARVLRGLILDIVIDVVSMKAGGNTKYINQRDDSYLITLYVGENYRKNFIDALKQYIDMGNFKYAIYTNKIYKSIFKEHAQEYRAILNLTKTEDVRDTMYSEILTTISMYETGLAHEMKKKSDELERKLTPIEVDQLFDSFEQNPTWVPQIEMARMKMASRDYGLRSVIHPELVDYINPLDTADFERFLGEKSKELAKRIEEYQDVFKRLKDK
jgi:hypothetical protein